MVPSPIWTWTQIGSWKMSFQLKWGSLIEGPSWFIGFHPTISRSMGLKTKMVPRRFPKCWDLRWIYHWEILLEKSLIRQTHVHRQFVDSPAKPLTFKALMWVKIHSMPKKTQIRLISPAYTAFLPPISAQPVVSDLSSHTAQQAQQAHSRKPMW